MYIKITKLSNAKDDKGGVLAKLSSSKVEFSSKIGNAIGWWIGETPIVGQSYNVELNIEEKLTWDEDITGIASEETLIKADNELITIQGELTFIYDDGFCIFSLQGSILHVATEGPPMPLGTYVKITVPRLYISDSNT